MTPSPSASSNPNKASTAKQAKTPGAASSSPTAYAPWPAAKIELALYDTKSQSMEAANGVSVLSDGGALALIGTFGTDSMNRARPVIKAAKIPTVTGSTAADLDRDYWITPYA